MKKIIIMTLVAVMTISMIETTGYAADIEMDSESEQIKLDVSAQEQIITLAFDGFLGNITFTRSDIGKTFPSYGEDKSESYLRFFKPDGWKVIDDSFENDDSFEIHPHLTSMTTDLFEKLINKYGSGSTIYMEKDWKQETETLQVTMRVIDSSGKLLPDNARNKLLWADPANHVGLIAGFDGDIICNNLEISTPFWGFENLIDTSEMVREYQVWVPLDGTFGNYDINPVFNDDLERNVIDVKVEPSISVQIAKGKPASVTVTYQLKGNDFSLAEVTGLKDFPYTGKAITQQTPVVKLDNTTLVQDRDYTSAYDNNVDVGRAELLITGIGRYSGTITRTFQIQFKDVTNANEFYYDPIYWAVDNSIVAGWKDGTFRPMNEANRAAVVTFLWRMKGKPEPKKTANFKDMTGNAEFDKAISWASENGIVKGWDDGTFRPWNTCNRAAIVTFLWRYAGKPTVSSKAGFKDMTGNSDFDKAISWAASKGITTGWNDNTFRPWDTCKRLAIVSFLNRYKK